LMRRNLLLTPEEPQETLEVKHLEITNKIKVGQISVAESVPNIITPGIQPAIVPMVINTLAVRAGNLGNDRPLEVSFMDVNQVNSGIDQVVKTATLHDSNFYASLLEEPNPYTGNEYGIIPNVLMERI